MSIELSYRQEPSYLFVELSGTWTTDDAKRAIEAIRSEADKRGLTRLLIDCRKFSKPDTEMTRFFTGEHIALIWGHPFKSVGVVRPEIYNGFAETVAINRGANVKAFFEEEEALEWLLEDSKKPGAGEA